MRRLTGLEPKQRERLDIRVEEEIVRTIRVHGLSPSDVANIGMELVLVRKGLLPDVGVPLDHTLLLDPEIITAIKNNHMNVSTVLNTGARMVLKEKGVSI